MDPRLQKLQARIASAIAGFSPEQFRVHPPGKWCAEEVLEHLYLTYTGTLKGLERVVEAGKPIAATTQSWAQRWRTLVVVGLGYFPSGREAPPVARPRGLPPEKILAEIGSKIADMDDLITRCEQRLGKGRKLLDHPILGPLTASQWKKFHLIHGLHHIRQLDHLRQIASQM